jgi:hypothetical protein
MDALLADGRADPAARNSGPLFGAALFGHTDVVKALLADGRADPAASDSCALRRALDRGHMGVVEALLADGRADLFAAEAACARVLPTGISACVSRWKRWLRRRQWLRAAGIGVGAWK